MISTAKRAAINHVIKYDHQYSEREEVPAHSVKPRRQKAPYASNILVYFLLSLISFFFWDFFATLGIQNSFNLIDYITNSYKKQKHPVWGVLSLVALVGLLASSPTRKIQTALTLVFINYRFEPTVLVRQVKKYPIRGILFLVALVGLEPTLLAELDFESSASTNSATGPEHIQQLISLLPCVLQPSLPSAHCDLLCVLVSLQVFQPHQLSC